MIQRNIRNGIDFTNPAVYATCPSETLREWMRPDNASYDEMPLVENRIQMLHQAGTILVQVNNTNNSCLKFNGSFSNLVAECGCSAQQLTQKVISEFGDLFDDTVCCKVSQTRFVNIFLKVGRVLQYPCESP